VYLVTAPDPTKFGLRPDTVVVWKLDSLGKNGLHIFGDGEATAGGAAAASPGLRPR
jgi:hypothetical protein